MGLSWDDLSDREKQDLARQYKIDKCYSIDYSKYNATPENFRRMIRRYMQDITNSPATYTPIDTAIDDTRRWQQTLKHLTNKNRFLQVMHLCDIQFPFQDDNALKVAYGLVNHVQPHVIVVGSDAFDFHMLSSFAIDPDHYEPQDQLDRAESFWRQHINDIHTASPRSELVFVWGNHERRLIKRIGKNAPEIRHTVWRRFADIIRCDGRVHWRGEIDHVEIGDLLVQHGDRTNKNASQSMLTDLGGQIHTMAGHIHRITFGRLPGYYRVAKSITSGCLTDLNPHYKRGEKAANWQHGTAIADVDTKGLATNLDNNLEFVADTDGQLMARLGLTTIK